MNIEVIIRMLHRRLNRAMGTDASQSDRNAWLQEELRAAKRRVPKIRDGVIDTVEATTDYATDPIEGSEADGAWEDLDDFDWGEPF